MHADLIGALEQINKSYKAFEHRGKQLSKYQVTKILKYGIEKGYKTTAEFTDEEVDFVLKMQPELPELNSETLPTVPGKSPERVHKSYDYSKYPEEWIAQYNMLLPDGVTCKECTHSNRCCSLFGQEETSESCQFHPNRFAYKIIAAD